MKKISYLKIIVMICVLGLLCACGTNKKENSDEVDGLIINNTEESSIKLGVSNLDTMNPIFTKSNSLYDSMQLIFEPLYSFDEGLNPIAVLAESATSSADGFSYTIKTKSGILWHDGTPFSAWDVIHTINLIMYNDTQFTSSFDCVLSVEGIDKNTLKINLKRPVPDFLSLLTFPVVKNGVKTEENENYIPVGTGPYSYAGKENTDEISLVISQNWRGEKPSVKKINLKILEDEKALIEAFNASEIDAITSKVFDIKENTPRGELNTYDYVGQNMVFVGINNQDSKLWGKNTRRAISYIINKDDIITNEIFSMAKKADIPVNPQYWYVPKASDVRCEEEYIKELLSLDGFNKIDSKFIRLTEETTEDGTQAQTKQEKLKIEIIINDNNEERLRIAQNIGKSLNDFGIETTVTLLSFEDYNSRILEKNYQIFIGEIKMTKTMDLYGLLRKEDNYFGYSSDVMNENLKSIGTAYAAGNQKEAYENFTKVFIEETPFIPLFFRKESVVFEKGISGTNYPDMFTAYKNPQNWYKSTKK